MSTAPSLQRLLAPRSVALIGGAWADAVSPPAASSAIAGEVWRIHPKRASTAAQRYFRSVDELPGAPDAAFVAAPNREVPAIAAALARRGAGGFVCFAAGFSEPATAEGDRLTRELAAERGRAALLRPQLLRLHQFLRSGSHCGPTRWSASAASAAWRSSARAAPSR